METIHLIPNWFVGFHISFEVVFMLATAIIAFYAFKIFKISEQRESRNFGIAFLFLSLSYLTLIILNHLFLSVLSGNLRSLDIDDLIGLKNLALSLYVIFLTLGFLILYHTTSKFKSTPNLILLAALSIMSIKYACEKSILIYFIPATFLLFITYNYFKDYYSNKNKNTLLLSSSMFFLLLSNLSLGSVAKFFQPNLYVLAHFIELIAYGIIIYTLMRVLNYGKKTKQIRGH